jgi:hypothetical protein
VRGEVNGEGKRTADSEGMMKTADGERTMKMTDGERTMKMADSERTMKTADDGLSFVAKGYWCLFLLCCLFTRTFYRVFIL